jgi:hypothetical protein
MFHTEHEKDQVSQYATGNEDIVLTSRTLHHYGAIWHSSSGGRYLFIIATRRSEWLFYMNTSRTGISLIVIVLHGDKLTRALWHVNTSAYVILNGTYQSDRLNTTHSILKFKPYLCSCVPSQ